MIAGNVFDETIRIEYVRRNDDGSAQELTQY